MNDDNTQAGPRLVLHAAPRLTFSVAFGEAVVAFTAQALGPNALAEWFDAAKGEPAVVALSKIIDGWEQGPQDDAGNALPFSRATLAALLDTDDDALPNILKAYTEARTEAARKN